MIYTSINNNKIKELKKLNSKKYRDETNTFLVEGDHLVLEAYKSGNLLELYLELGTIYKLDVETSYLSNNVIRYISELESNPKIMGLCRKKEEQKNLGNRILILDNIQDPGNLGTIIRSAVAFNISTIIVSGDTVDIYNSKVIRASQGMLFQINILRRDLINEIPNLKELGYNIYSTNVNDGKNIKTIETIKKFAIIMGNEGVGVKKEILDLSDSYIYINMNKKCESLNVAVATSIILYELDK